MPIYEYRCPVCDEEFEAFRSISSSDAEVACPKCGQKNPQRKLSSFIGKSSSSASGNLQFPT